MKPNARFNNSVKVEGYVYSMGSNFNQLSMRVTGERSKNPGTNYIAGDLDVAVDEAGLNVVTVHYTYVTEFTKSGSPSATYATLKKLIENPDKTWISGGKENAFKIQCSAVSLGVNDFIGRDGTKVAALRNQDGFCNIVNELCPEEERNTFTADMLVTKIIPVEANEEKNIPEDYIMVSGCIFGWGPTIVPATFSVKNKTGIDYFENLDVTNSSPVFTKVWGKINCMTIKVEGKREEAAFGEPAVRTYERKTREYLITGAAKVPYDFGDEDVLTAADVTKMSQDRQIKLAEIEKRFNEQKEKSAQSFKNTMPVPEGGFVF